MEAMLALTIGVLYAISFYLMLRRSIVKLIFGLMLFGQAVNLLIFTAAGLTPAQAPIIPYGQAAPPAPFADPLPQAFILTAIVIGFGVLSFTIALAYRVYRALGSDNSDTREDDR